MRKWILYGFGVWVIVGIALMVTAILGDFISWLAYMFITGLIIIPVTCEIADMKNG